MATKSSDVQVSVEKDTRAGCWGLPFVEWLRVTAIFLVMWTLLGIFFWGLLQAGLSVRGTQFLALDPKFFGPFDRTMVPVVSYNPDAANPALGSTGYELVNMFNRGKGCTGTETSVSCSSEESAVWALGNWTKSAAWAKAFGACGDDVMDTTINPSFDFSAGGQWTGYCLNVLPLNAFDSKFTAQPYPTAGLVSA